MIKALWKHRSLPPEQQLAKVNQSTKTASKAAKDKPAGGKDASATATTAAAGGTTSPVTPTAMSIATAGMGGKDGASGGKDAAPLSPSHSTISLQSSGSTRTDSDFGQVDQLDLDDLPRAASQMLECDDSVFLGGGTSEVIETITMDLPLSVCEGEREGGREGAGFENEERTENGVEISSEKWKKEGGVPRGSWL